MVIAMKSVSVPRASLTVRNLDAATKQALRERAARAGHSMEAEIRQLLEQAVGREPAMVSRTGFEGSAGVAVSAGGNAAAGLAGKRIVVVIGGGIAAYKSLDLIRRLRERGGLVRCVMTPAAQQFVTALATGAVSGSQVFCDLFDRAAEHDVGHVRLARECDLVIVAPATANLMARIALGMANDLATAVLLATRAPILLAPAMNPAMWANPATARNVARLRADGMAVVGPETGEMAESGEAGTGRMSEPLAIVAAAEKLFKPQPGPLRGLRAVVTSGPTHEPVDPVRYIANRSSGKQGHAIAAALAEAGAEVVLVSGPVNLPDPPGVDTVHVETARQMQAAVEKALPAQIAVMVAAVADWRTEGEAAQKMKKQVAGGPPVLRMVENPDILKGVANHPMRPGLVIGFAAETERLIEHAREKLLRKGADWIVANDVSGPSGVMGGDVNTVRLISPAGVEEWPTLDKAQVAQQLVERICAHFRETPVTA